MPCGRISIQENKTAALIKYNLRMQKRSTWSLKMKWSFILQKGWYENNFKKHLISEFLQPKTVYFIQITKINHNRPPLTF